MCFIIFFSNSAISNIHILSSFSLLLLWNSYWTNILNLLHFATAQVTNMRMPVIVFDCVNGKLWIIPFYVNNFWFSVYYLQLLIVGFRAMTDQYWSGPHSLGFELHSLMIVSLLNWMLSPLVTCDNLNCHILWSVLTSWNKFLPVVKCLISVCFIFLPGFIFYKMHTFYVLQYLFHHSLFTL